MTWDDRGRWLAEVYSSAEPVYALVGLASLFAWELTYASVLWSAVLMFAWRQEPPSL